MKKIISLLILGSALSNLYAQHNNSLGIDCNPRLNDQEINHLGNMFPAYNYDFKNKTIGFAAHKVKRICGVLTIGGLTMPRWAINKKQYFAALVQDSCKKTISKLLVLNDDQKKQSGGFDAIVLLVSKNKEKKIDRKIVPIIAEEFNYRTLNYPSNLHLVGNDDRADLTDEDAVFFNTIYNRKGFDFKGKKVAFMNPHLIDEKQAIRTKKEFIGNIKKHLRNDFLYPAAEELAVFSTEEKKESGGYDAMIIYQTKKSNRWQLIQILKHSNSK